MLATSNEVSQSQPQPSVAGCAAGAAAAPVAAAAAAASSERALPEWLRSRRVGHLSHVFYVPDYIDEDQESRLLQRISSSAGKWTQVSGRRLQQHGGVVGKQGLIAAPLPDWLSTVASRLHRETQVFGDQAPNHVLINAYRPGEGIMPHEDGPMYWPGVCILSLAAPAVIRFRRKRAAAAADDVTNGPPGDSTSTPPQRLGRPAAAPDLQDLLLSLLLMPRSLLVFTDDAYSGCLHGIDFTEVEELDTSVANLAACGLTASTSAAAGNPSGATSAFDSATSAVDDSDMGALPTTAPLSSDNGVSEGRNVGSANGEVVEAFDSAVQHSQQPAQPSDDAASASGRDDVAAARPPSVLPRGGERVSLTVRRVLKVFNNLIKTK